MAAHRHVGRAARDSALRVVETPFAPAIESIDCVFAGRTRRSAKEGPGEQPQGLVVPHWRQVR